MLLFMNNNNMQIVFDILLLYIKISITNIKNFLLKLINNILLLYNKNALDETKIIELRI